MKDFPRAALMTASFVFVAALNGTAHAEADTAALVHLATLGQDAPPIAELASALRRGLSSAGLRVSALPPTPSAGTCEDLPCLQALARSFEASVLAFAHLQTSAQDYEVRLRVVHATTGELLTSDSVRCGLEDLCPPMPQTLQRLAKEAGRKTRQRLADLQPAQTAPPVAAPEPAPQFAPPRIYDATPPNEAANTAWVPWTLATVGSASLLTGGVLLAAHSTCTTQESCTPRDFATWGWTLSAVGLVAAGTAAALWFTHSAPAQDGGLALNAWAADRGAGVVISGHWH